MKKHKLGFKCSKLMVIAGTFLLCTALFVPFSWGASATVTATVSEDGASVEVRADGTFASCTTCNQDGENCTTRNNGSVSLSNLYAYGNGSATYSRIYDRASLNGTRTFTATASDCQGSASASYTLTLDNTPTVSVNAPSGTLSEPFDFTGTATFKPTLSATKGTISLYINNTTWSAAASKTCTTEVCDFSYQEVIGKLYDMNHGGPYTFTLVARGGGTSASATGTFSVDKTPTVSVSAPSGTLSEPFDITGTATFKPTLSATKGTISLYINNTTWSAAASKTCTTEVCNFSYQEITGNLYDMNHGGPYKVKLVANGGGTSASATGTFSVDKTPTVSVSAPSGTLSEPFDITGTATFKPTLSAIKGTIITSVYNASGAFLISLPSKTCTTETCTYSYQELTGSLYDPNHGSYSIKMTASVGGISVSDQKPFSVNKTPMVSATGPTGTISAPFDITGTATFKPTLTAIKGYISGAILSANGYLLLALPSKTCTTETCTYSYQELTGNLYDLNQGTYSVRITASGGGALVSDQKPFSVDKTPTVSATGPTGTISAPFDITGTATFKPTLTATKGYISGAILSANGYLLLALPSKTCTTETCTYSYQELTGNLYDLNQGTYSVRITASGGGALVSEQKPFSVDKTPTVSVTGPIGTTSAPFDITGTAIFKPTLTAIKGYISGTILTANGYLILALPSKTCTTETCTYSYQELAGKLYSLAPGGPYTVKLTANGGGAIASDTKSFSVVDCDIDVTVNSYSATLNAGVGQSIPIDGSIVESSGKTVNWLLAVGHDNFSGEGHTAHVMWDGFLENGKILPGAYNGSLQAETDASCTDTKTFKVNVVEDEPCRFKVSVGSSGNVASGELSDSLSLFSLSGSGPALGVSLSYQSRDGFDGSLGLSWSHNYEINAREQVDGSVVVRNGDGGYRTYLPENGGYRSRPGDNATLIRNSDGTFMRTRKDGIRENFAADGRISSITDRNANTLTFAYAGGQLQTVSDSTGRSVSFAYDAIGHLTSIADPAGQVYDLTVGETLESVTFPDGGVWRYGYAANAFLNSKTDPLDHLTTYSYDDQHRVVASTDPEGRSRAITYPSADETVRTTTFTEKDGGEWQYTYDTVAGDLLAKTDPVGNVTSYTYDANHNQLSKTDASGTATSTYDAAGNLTTATDVAGQITSYAYNAFGQTTSIIAPDGGVTRYDYDERGNLTSTTDASGTTTGYTYDSAGRTLSVTAADGGITRMGYDTSGNLASVTDPSGATQRLEYDASGRMIRQIDPQGGVTTFAYDSRGNLIQSVDPLGNISTATYDANGRKTSATDANGNTTRFESNAQGQVLKSIDALDNVTSYAYGGSGCPSCGGGGGEKLSSLTDANGQTTNFEYDQLGRLAKETDPLGNVTSYAYDAKGNLTAKTDANGATIRYSYDALGRLVKKVYPDNSEENFSYDSKGNLLSAANANASYAFTYDIGGRTTSVSDGDGRVIQYRYDSAGRKSQTTYPEGSLVSQVYDSAGRLQEIHNGGGRVYRFGYDTSSRRSSLTFPNGVIASYAYDSAGRLTALSSKNASGEILAKSVYTLDKVGNRQSRTDTRSKADYGYDLLYRLREALSSTPGSSANTSGKGKGIANAVQQQKEFYTYDPVGNRLSSEKTPLYTYNAANQLLTNGGSYRYDKNGNLIERTTDEGSTTYTWDYENRLVQVKLPTAATVEFKYDPLGRRIEKKATESSVTTTTRYVYDNEDIILEYDSNGSVTNKYVHGPGIDEPLAVTQGKETYFYHADGLGSVVALTDKAGKVVQDYQYDSFGNLKDQKNRIKQPFTYTGREWDKETGLYYYRARYFDPTAGRFISKDPIGFAGGDVNVYRYVRNSPVNLADPTGEKISVYTRSLDFGFNTGPYVHCVLEVTDCNENKQTWDFQGDNDVYKPAKQPNLKVYNEKTVVVYEADDKDQLVTSIADQYYNKFLVHPDYSVGNYNCCNWVEDVLHSSNISWANPNPWPANNKR